MESLQSAKKLFDDLFSEMSKVIVGQKPVIEQMLISILCDGNVLLEGYPGLAKTLAVKTLSEIMDLKFSRIQFTPDLMPSDITGTYIVDETKGKRDFTFIPGPVFANIILADEINRATPKTQSALLEAMQEKQVTVGNKTFKLDLPFFVLATQNPIEQEGTYPLPEAQQDRFLLKVKLDYPQFDEELKIVDLYAGENNNSQKLKTVITKEKLLNLQKLARQIPIAHDIKKYAVNIVNLTRNKKDLIEYGASPRASLALVLTAKAKALLEGRTYVTKNDIIALSTPVLRHRIILNFEAERNNLTEDDVIKQLISKA